MTLFMLISLLSCRPQPPEAERCELSLPRELTFQAAAGACDAQSLSLENTGDVAVECLFTPLSASCGDMDAWAYPASFILQPGHEYALDLAWCPDLVSSCVAELKVVCEAALVPVEQTLPECSLADGDETAIVTLRGLTYGADADQDLYHEGDADDPASDCDDLNPWVHPGAPEVENHTDDDCDGEVDEGTALDDQDGDGYSPWQGDCDDDDASVHPGATELPNSRDDDCDGWEDNDTILYDDDGDGFAESGPTGGDCDDASAWRFPGAAETADKLDQDCDYIVDEGTGSYDDDGDGFSEQEGDRSADGASWDNNNTVFPGAAELPDGLDNDLDGAVDEETVLNDDDGDGFSEAQGDCDDSNAAVHPDADDDPDTKRDERC